MVLDIPQQYASLSKEAQLFMLLKSLFKKELITEEYYWFLKECLIKSQLNIHYSSEDPPFPENRPKRPISSSRLQRKRHYHDGSEV